MFVLAAVAARAAWSRLSTPDLDPGLLAIAPFDAADAPLAAWRQGLLDLLAQNLSGAGPLKVVPPCPHRGRMGRARGRIFGRRPRPPDLRAHGIVGSTHPRGADSVRLTAAIYEVGSRRLLGDLQVVLPVARMDQGTDSITVGVLPQE